MAVAAPERRRRRCGSLKARHMCGLVGAASTAPLEMALLESQRDLLTHRGPDACGFWQSEDGRVALGHRRLSILDLSERGAQPMDRGAGAVVVVLNGEIYNHAELREELRSRGHSFRSTSDTEVLLEAYRAWGADCLPRLRGMFAFAIHDREQSHLFLGRDRAGEKPLFFSRSPGRFSFASEIKALFLDPGVERRMDLEALHEYLAYGYVPGGRSLVRGVAKLQPGHGALYQLDRDHFRMWRYWSLPDPGIIPSGAPGGADALAAELETLLESAVGEQLVADVPVGVLLSGGLDSSLVAAFAARASPRPVRTFTVSFPGHAGYDEAPHARLVADHIGAEHTELVAEAASVDLLPLLAGQYDEPLADSSMIPTYLVSRRIREHATVALGGDGGDELFAGYPHYNWIQWQARLRRLSPAAVRRGVAAGASWLPVGLRGRNHLVGLGGALEGSIAHVNLYFDRRTREMLLRPLGAHPDAAAAPERRCREAVGEGTPLRRATALDFHRYLVDDILTKVDRASMLASLEVRAPFLDHRLIEFAFGRVPDRLRATMRERKVLLRRVASSVLPATLDLKRKQGFSIPLHEWFRGAWGEYMRDVLASAPRELFEPNAIDMLFAQQARGRSNTHRLFSLTMLELWRREYGVALP